VHDETDPTNLPDQKPNARRSDRGVPAVTFGLGVAALAGLVATAGAAAATASAAGADNAQPVAVAAALSPMYPHITCSGNPPGSD
jgi:hypothetical protein